ncbi:MAG: hypothetical protein ABL931_14710 [Usitatibacteraceae bacterium]
MGRLSARSNPTGLREIDRNRVAISVTEIAGRRCFSLERLDVKGMDLSEKLKVVVVARAGNTTNRYDVGTVGDLNRNTKSLEALDRSHPLRFRILLHEADQPMLIASVENLRPRNESQSESLLPMEAAELGERLWKLVIEDDGPVLQFNSRVFPNAAGAENFAPFGALVLPEALRQVMEYISAEPARLADESDPWCTWGDWIDAVGAERPPSAGDDAERRIWCDQVVDRFCTKFAFASQMQSDLQRENKND